jgi:hypothetical protein
LRILPLLPESAGDVGCGWEVTERKTTSVPEMRKKE